MQLSEEEVNMICDDYCKYAESWNKYIAAAKKCASGEALQELIDYAHRKLEDQCEKCPFSEVKHE